MTVKFKLRDGVLSTQVTYLLLLLQVYEYMLTNGYATINNPNGFEIEDQETSKHIGKVVWLDDFISGKFLDWGFKLTIDYVFTFSGPEEIYEPLFKELFDNCDDWVLISKS